MYLLPSPHLSRIPNHCIRRMISPFPILSSFLFRNSNDVKLFSTTKTVLLRGGGRSVVRYSSIVQNKYWLRQSFSSSFLTITASSLPSSSSTFSPSVPVSFSSSSSSSPKVTVVLSPLTGNTMVDSLLIASHSYPVTTGFIWIYHGLLYASVGTSIVYGLTSLLSLSFATVILPPAALGPAFLLHTATRRLRLPIVIGLAAVMARRYPVLTKAPIGTLLSAPMMTFVPPPSSTRTTTTSSTSSSSSSSLNILQRIDRLVGASDMVNQYGLAYTISGRIVGTVSLLSITYLLHYGINVNMYVDQLYSYLPNFLVTNVDNSSTTVAASSLPSTETISSPSPSSALSLFSWFSTATNFTVYWASGCLLANICYPYIVTYGIGRFGLFLGSIVKETKPISTQDPLSLPSTTITINSLSSLSSVAVASTVPSLSNVVSSSSSVCSKADDKNNDTNNGHWISKYYKNDVNCWHCF